MFVARELKEKAITGVKNTFFNSLTSSKLCKRQQACRIVNQSADKFSCLNLTATHLSRCVAMRQATNWFALIGDLGYRDFELKTRYVQDSCVCVMTFIRSPVLAESAQRAGTQNRAAHSTLRRWQSDVFRRNRIQTPQSVQNITAARFEEPSQWSAE